VLSLDASLVEAGFFAAGWDLLVCLAADLSCDFAAELPGCISCRSWIGLPTGPVRHGLTADQDANEQAAN
jgi:hypothetical protein